MAGIEITDKYVLAEDGRTPVPCPDLLEWAAFFEKVDRVVAKVTVGDYVLSTIFLGIVHGVGPNGPLLWETMIFYTGEGDDPLDISNREERWASYEEAVAGHSTAYRYLEEILED